MEMAYLGPKRIVFIIPNKNSLGIHEKPLTSAENLSRVLVLSKIVNI